MSEHKYQICKNVNSQWYDYNAFYNDVKSEVLQGRPTISLKEVQAWLGHSNISITANVYTHVDTEMKQNTTKTIEEIIKQY